MARNTTKTISYNAWNSPVENPSGETKHDTKEFQYNMLNTLFKDNIPGTETTSEVRRIRTIYSKKASL